jgi:AraC-like DNA-binding protein
MQDYPKIFLYRRLVQSKLYIDNNFSDKLLVIDIADEAYCSRFHFIRLFKKVYGRTPHQYLTFVRLGEARLKLRENLSVNEVCYSVGFESPKTFATLFKRTFGQTPSDYRDAQIRLAIEQKEAPLKFVPGCITDKFELDQI